MKGHVVGSFFLSKATKALTTEFRALINELPRGVAYVDIVSSSEGDGLDLSGSLLELKNSTFEGMGDKGLSVGENSTIKVSKLNFLDNHLDIAVKDGSQLITGDNGALEYDDLRIEYYNKKYFYAEPKKPVIFEK